MDFDPPDRLQLRKYRGSVSEAIYINASNVEGSGLGPLNFIMASIFLWLYVPVRHTGTFSKLQKIKIINVY